MSLRLLNGKVEKVHVVVGFVLFNTIMQSDSSTMKFYMSKSFCDLGQKSHVSRLLTFSKGFYTETTGQFHVNFICTLLAKVERKYAYLVQVT